MQYSFVGSFNSLIFVNIKKINIRNMRVLVLCWRRLMMVPDSY